MDQALDLRGLHALVVDDDLDCLEMLATTLSFHGAFVHQASSARAALGILKPTRPDVIISDIGMPRESGFWFIRQYRKLAPPGQRALVIALTGFDGVVDQAKAAGFDAVLLKPLNLAAFCETLRNLGLVPSPRAAMTA
jgi:CheY-like chemotaxis protein